MKLDKYQLEGVKLMTKWGRAILADPTGIGKTGQAIMSAVQTGERPVLVVANKSLIPQWARAIREWAGEDQIIGVIETKRKIPQADWLLTNYEVLLKRDLPKYPTLIVDEAHKIKNRKAQRTKAVWKLARSAKNVWLLTGTPMTNRPHEIWSLLRCLYPKKYSSFWRWVNYYCETSNNGFGIEIGGIKKDRLEEFQEEMAGVMIRRDKSILNLPPLSEEVVYLQLERRQEKLYVEMLRDMMTLIGDNLVISPNVLTQLLRLRQLALSPRLLGDKSDSNKTKYIKDLLEDYGRDEKFIIFSTFSEYVKELETALYKFNPVSIYGDKSRDERDQAVQRIQHDPATRVIIGTYEAMGEGLDMQSASQVVMADLPWTPDKLEQAYSRAYRRGQTAEVHVRYLLSEGTVDTYIWDVLGDKKQMVSEALVMREVLKRMSTA